MFRLVLTFLQCIVFCGVFAQSVSKYEIHFKPDKYDLWGDAKKILDSIANSVKKYKSYSIEIVGHTDADGSVSYNEKLSKNREAAVKEYLKGKNCTGKLSEKYKGELKPVASNETAQGKQKNRRTEIIIKYEPLPVSTGRVDDLYGLLKKESQIFCIDPARDTVLSSTAGMYLLVKANTFKIPAYSEKKCVTLTLDEAFDKSDMLMADLSTASNNEMLITGGMFRLDAEYEGKKVEPAAGGLLSFMPTKQYDPNMRLFTGTKDAHSNEVNWLLENGGIPGKLNAQDLLHCTYDYNAKSYRYKCRTLNCRVKNFFRGITGKNDIYNTYNSGRSKGRCQSLQALYKKYKVSNLDQLAEAMKKERMEQIENKLSTAGGKLNASDVNYYLFDVPKLGWINCDRFSGYGKSQLANLDIMTDPGNNMDVKIVFKNIRSVMPGARTENGYQFANIPKHEEVWLVAIKYEAGQAFLAMKEVRVTDEPVGELAFEKCTLPQLKEKLKLLDS